MFKVTRGLQIEVPCIWCKKPFMARVADRKRGWAKYCSKKCKAYEQENRTGQYRSWAARQCARVDGHPKKITVVGRYIVEDDEFDPSWDSHKNDF